MYRRYTMNDCYFCGRPLGTCGCDGDTIAADMLRTLNSLPGVTASLTAGGAIAVMTKAGSMADAKVTRIYSAKIT